jgi:hypothetical protein
MALYVFSIPKWPLLSWNVSIIMVLSDFRKITSLSSLLRLIQFNFLSFITYFQVSYWGIEKTYNAISEIYYWKNVYSDVSNHIKSCPKCQHCGYLKKTDDVLHPIPIVAPWYHPLYEAVCLGMISRWYSMDSICFFDQRWHNGIDKLSALIRPFRKIID